MSVFEQILVNLRDIIQNSEEFKDIDVYFDDSEMSPNQSLPAVSFKIGKKEVIQYCVDGTEYVRHMEIRLHTETIDKRLLQSELYDYEEQLAKILINAEHNGQMEDFYEIKETGSRSIGALMFNARKEANQFNMIFFSNILRVSFDIRYKI